MSESPPPAFSGNAAGSSPEGLTPAAIEAVLDDFRSWLQQLAVAPADSSAAPAEPEPIDLHTLLGQFIALRHEVNLQTKAVRSQQELNNETLQHLRETLETLRRQQEAAWESGQQTETEIARPLLKTLIDVHDALSL